MDELKTPDESPVEDAAKKQPAGNLARNWRGSESTPPGTPDLQTAIAQVGEPLENFRCVNILLLIWAFSGVLFVIACVGLSIGALYLIFVKHSRRFELIQAVVLPFGVALGWVITRNAWSRMGSRVLLCERGIIYQHRRGVTVFPWNEIIWVTHDDDTATPGRSGFPSVKMATEFTVHRVDGVTFPFSLYNLRRHIKLARAIFNSTHPLGTKWGTWQEYDGV